MKTISNQNTQRLHACPGFASMLTVISVGVALLLILIAMYDNTVESQAVQKNNMLKNDYQQREEAFLRAMTSIIPSKAMLCMQDESQNVASTLTWKQVMTEALAIANAHTSVDANVSASLGISTMRNANTANSSMTLTHVVNALPKVPYVGQSQQATGHWEDVIVRTWIPGYTISGKWVPGYTIPGEWVPGYWKRKRNKWRWIRGYWTDEVVVPGYWTPDTVVNGRWEEKTEKKWVEDPNPNQDPKVTGNIVISGTNRSANSEFPPPLECSAAIHVKDSTYPIVSHIKKYGVTSTGWVSDDVKKHPLYNRVKAPRLHFNYQSGSTMIAKHNWWGFELSLSEQDTARTKIKRRTKKYLISLYEIPAQLSINASSYATMGAHADGTAWSNISNQGGVFAEKIKTEGAFAAAFLSSRKGTELSAEANIGGTIGSTAGTNPFSGHARERAQSQGLTFPISSASDAGRVAFIPINRGLEFYDRFVGSGDVINSTRAVSPTSWDFYSIGAKQCHMRLDIIDVVSSSDQTPTTIRFSYSVNGTMTTVDFAKGNNWPDPTSNAGLKFPFHTQTTSSGRPSLAVHIGRLKEYLASQKADQYEVNKSLSINVDYVNNPSIQKPSFPSLATDLAVTLLDAKDLSMFTKGFSLVTNLRLVIADDTNIVAMTPPAELKLPSGQDYFPPLSMFAPEKRYGDSGINVPVQLEGQLGSMAKGNTSPVRIADLKSGSKDEVVPENIRASLKPINHPAALPPISMMNWMVVIREIHPRFIRPAGSSTTP